MKQTIHLILVLICSVPLSAQKSVDFDPYQFQRNATDQVLSSIESSLIDKIEEAVAAGEKELSPAIYLEDMLEPLKSYGIDPQKEGYYKDIQEFYEKYTSDPDFDPAADVRSGFEGMIKTKISNEIYTIIGKENVDMAEQFKSLFTSAQKKITAILKAVDGVSHIEDAEEKTSMLKAGLEKAGITGAFFDAVGDLEILIGNTVEEITDPLNIITAIVKASTETNPTNKIKMLFDFGESYGGRIPIVGDIVQSLFTIGKKLIEASEIAGGIIESNVDQFCIYSEGSHNYYNNEKKYSFVNAHQGVDVCPLRNKSIYKNIYVNQKSNTTLFFYLNNSWQDATQDQYHKGGDDIFAMVQWLVRNGYPNEAKNLDFVSNAYNKIYGFSYFKDQVIRSKLFEIKELSDRVMSKIKLCEDNDLELFFMDLIGFEKINQYMQANGGFNVDDINFLSSSSIEEITNEIVKRRYIGNEVGLISSLNAIAKNLSENIPSTIYGKATDEKGNQLQNVSVSPSNGAYIIFNDSDCDKSKTSVSGSYEFLFIPNSNSEELLNFEANYEGVKLKKELIYSPSKSLYQIDFKFVLNKDEEESEEELETASLSIFPTEASIEIGEEISFSVQYKDESGQSLDVTNEAYIINPFSSRRSGDFTISASYKDLVTNAVVKVLKKKEESKSDSECEGDHEEWNLDLSICQCKSEFKRNEQGDCVRIDGSDPEEDKKKCPDDLEKWNEKLQTCECIDGYARNKEEVCVKKVEDKDSDNEKKECSEDYEKWNVTLEICQCIDGYTRNEKGDCVVRVEENELGNEEKECSEVNEKWNVSLEICECIEGYTRNDNGKCVEKVEGNDPRGNINTCYRDNEVWDTKKQDCICIAGFSKDKNGKCTKTKQEEPCNCPNGQICNAAGECVPIEESIDKTEEGLEEDCLKFSEVEARINRLLSEYRGLEGQVERNIRKFNKEINDRLAVPCENKLLSFSYFSVQAHLERMEQIERRLRDIYLTQISFLSFSNQCPSFSNDMAAAGFTNSFVTNELGKFAALKARIAGLDEKLIENGCDPEVVEQEGQTVQPPGSDPDFIDNGGTATEIDGDGKDNDGDGQQDEIPAQGLPGYNVTIVVYDSGTEKDDIFGLDLTGQGFLGNTPKGGLRSYGLNLPPGDYTGRLEVVLAADDIGTYTITVLHNNMSLYFDRGDPPEGTRIPFSFTVME